MRDHVEGTRRVSPLRALAATLFSLLGTVATAQPYEHVFGPPDASDQGAPRVCPVAACPDAASGGFLAVGTSLGPGGAADVLLVRTDAAGIPLWEKTYDIGPGWADQGGAVVEARNGSGYVVAGWSREPANGPDLLLMKVDCDGEPLWARTYHGQENGTEVAYDAVEARTGNPAFGTQPGAYRHLSRQPPGAAPDLLGHGPRGWTGGGPGRPRADQPLAHRSPGPSGPDRARG